MNARAGWAATALVFLLMAVPPSLSASAAPQPQALGDSHDEIAPFQLLGLDNPVDLVASCDCAYPEAFLDPSDASLLLSYDNNKAPFLARYNSTTGAAISAPVQVFTTPRQEDDFSDEARGSRTSLGPNGTVARMHTWYGTWPDPGDEHHIQVRNQTGGVVIPDTLLGYSSNLPYPQMAPAMGWDGTVHVLRTVTVWVDSDPNNNRYSVAYDQLTPAGNHTIDNRTVRRDGGDYRFVHLIADDARGRLIATYHDLIMGTSFMALLDLNGNETWGPVTKSSGEPWEPYLAPDGSVYLVWGNASRVSTTVYDANMTLVRDGATAVSAGATVTLPQVVSDGAGNLFFAYVLDGGNGPEAWMSAVNESTLAAIAPAVQANSGAAPAIRPRVLSAGPGAGWLVWHRLVTATPGSTEAIQASRFGLREVGFSMDGPAQAITAYRGENITIRARLSNAARDVSNFDLSTAFTQFRGPSNWTRRVVDASTGLNVSAVSLAAFGSLDVDVIVTPPRIDPAGYGAFIVLNATSTDVPGRSVQLAFNLTVLAGRSFSFSPASQNFTVLPGDQAQIYFAIRNTGVLPEDGAPLRIGLAPPPGWNATLSRNNITALPGEVVAVSLVVRAAPTALSTDVYCTVVRVESPSDPFTLATGSFCVQTALVAAPLVSPINRSVDISAGETLPVVWTLENVGNAAAPIPCSLAVIDTLPSGWFVLGNPASVSLGRNSAGNVSLSFTAPDGVAGDFSMVLTVRGSCQGYGGTIDGTIEVRVRTVHSIIWRSPGTSATANVTGAAAFLVTAENRGNVPEPLGFHQPTLPSGWSASIAWTVAGAPAAAVRPGETATGRLTVQSTEGTLAYSYPLTATFTSGGGDFTAAYTVRVDSTYGLAARFSPDAVEALPGDVVAFSLAVEHGGNALDTYSVIVGAPSGWDWTSEYVPDPGAAPGLLTGTSLQLDAFARGTLYLYVAVPPSQGPADRTVAMALASSKGPRVDFNGTVSVVAPDLAVRIDSLPNGTADPVLVGEIRITVTCAGPRAVANTSVEIWVDDARAFESPVGPLCPPASASFTVTLSLGPGNHTVEAVVDPLGDIGPTAARGRVAESDEDNNRADGVFTVADAPSPPDQEPPPDDTQPTGGAGADLTLLVVLLSALAGGALGVFALLRSRRGSRAEELALQDENELL